MPQSWQTHWPLADDDHVAAARRDAAVQTLGNLTLVTSALNPSMSNAPWDDASAQAAGLAKGKRTALLHSVLRLNNTLTAYDTWDEQSIEARGLELAARANRIWARPKPTTAVTTPAPQPDEAESAGVQPQLEEHAGKYIALFNWLKQQDTSEIATTFGAIEAILGMPLPPSSREHLAHWYSYEGSAVARAVFDAGWKATKVDLTAGTLTFVRSF